MWLRKFAEGLAAIIILVFALEGFFIALSPETNEIVRREIDAFNMMLYERPTLRVATLVASGLFLVTSLSVAFTLLKFSRREKVVSLPSPHGEVTVSLGAIEDFIKMIKDRMHGVKELRPKVFARKNGLKIYVRAALWSDHNIHETAQEIQGTIRRYVQDTLGIEQIETIRVFVGKILYREDGMRPPTLTSRGIQYQELHD